MEGGQESALMHKPFGVWSCSARASKTCCQREGLYLAPKSTIPLQHSPKGALQDSTYRSSDRDLPYLLLGRKDQERDWSKPIVLVGCWPARQRAGTHSSTLPRNGSSAENTALHPEEALTLVAFDRGGGHRATHCLFESWDLSPTGAAGATL